MFRICILFAVIALTSGAPTPQLTHFLDTPVVATAPVVHSAPLVHAVEAPVIAAAPVAIHAEPVVAAAPTVVAAAPIAAPLIHPAVPIGGYAANYVAPAYGYHGDLHPHYW